MRRMAGKENKVKDKSENANKPASRAKKGKSAPKKRAQKASKPQNAFTKSLAFLTSAQGRKVFGLLILLVSIVMLISFVSHFFTGYIDQTRTGAPANWLGSVGAWLSQLFVYRGFGLLAIIIPIYTGLLGLAVIEKKYSPILFKALKYVFFGVLWGSVFLAFISFLIWKSPSLLGGGFGWYINEMLNYPISRIGTGLVIAMAFVIFLVINFNIDLPFSKLLPKAKSEEEAENEEEGEKEDGEKPEETEEKAEDGKENEAETEDRGKKQLEIEISVRPANDDPKKKDAESVAAKTEEKSPEQKAEKVEEKTPEVVEEKSNNSDGLVIEEELVIIPAKKTKIKPPAELDMEVNLPSPDEIPEITTFRNPALDHLKENADGQNPSSKDQGTESPATQDNIKEKEGGFEKIVPEDSLETLEGEEEVADWAEYDPTLELRDYQYPTIDLLIARDASASREVNRSELEENKNKIVQTLQHYKIDIVSIKATIGPTVTLYEIVPAPGVRISKIRNLEDDIALSLSALGIRIIAPIPGKGTIGIEIPNSNPEIVSMRSVMSTEKFRDTEADLPLVLGRTISNEVYIADLAKMPHLLIAGATGQGKSVGINGIISSILYRKHPSQVKFVLIDPKKVELSLYSDLENHFLAMLEANTEPIITDTKQVIHVLNSLCIEMDARYDLLKKAGTRNLKEYNAKFTSRRLNPKKGHRFMPYIVLIIDEFADLMMTAGKEIETPIARLAQLARAIGIHLILATQRPSVNVITGIIKANFPARISFRVTSKVDSRTILDTGGADQLVGRGDLLLSTGSEVVRIQNAFIDTPEVDALVKSISNQRGYPAPYYLPEVPTEGDDNDLDDDDLNDRDDYFGDAARLVVKHQQGSTSLIQRRLKLGYNRAGRIIDQLEKAGVVGPFQGSKARDVLVQDEYTLEQIINGLD